MSGIGRFKLSDALGKDTGASKTAKEGGKEKKGGQAASPGTTTRGQVGEAGRGHSPMGHQKVVGGGRGG